MSASGVAASSSSSSLGAVSNIVSTATMTFVITALRADTEVLGTVLTKAGRAKGVPKGTYQFDSAGKPFEIEHVIDLQLFGEWFNRKPVSSGDGDIPAICVFSTALMFDVYKAINANYNLCKVPHDLNQLKNWITQRVRHRYPQFLETGSWREAFDPNLHAAAYTASQSKSEADALAEGKLLRPKPWQRKDTEQLWKSLYDYMEGRRPFMVDLYNSLSKIQDDRGPIKGYWNNVLHYLTRWIGLSKPSSTSTSAAGFSGPPSILPATTSAIATSSSSSSSGNVATVYAQTAAGYLALAAHHHSAAAQAASAAQHHMNKLVQESGAMSVTTPEELPSPRAKPVKRRNSRVEQDSKEQVANSVRRLDSDKHPDL